MGRTRRTRRTRRNNSHQFRPNQSRRTKISGGEKPLHAPPPPLPPKKHIAFSESRLHGYNLANVNNKTVFKPNNKSYMKNLVESRKGIPERTPIVVGNVSLNPEESQKYAELYHTYVLNNSPTPDENLLNAINADSSISNSTKKKLVKHFLASLEEGSELNQIAGISKIYEGVNSM